VLRATFTCHARRGSGVRRAALGPLTPQHLRPALERQVRRHDHARPLVGRADHVEQQLGPHLARRHVTELVQHQQVQPRQLAAEPAQHPLLTRLQQLRQQLRHAEEPHPLAALAGRRGQPDGHVRLPGPRATQQNYRLAAVDIFAPRQLHDQRPVQRRLGREVELVQRLQLREPRRLEPPLTGPPLPVCQLALAQPQQEAEVVDVLTRTLPRQLLALRLDRRQVQGRQVVLEQDHVGRRHTSRLHRFTPFAEVRVP
jgi:hypothetical protein